jgi:hypothetical protein
MCGARSPRLKKFVDGQVDVRGDLAQQRGRDIATCVDGTVVVRPSGCRNCLCEPRWRTSAKPRASSRETTCRGLRTGRLPTAGQATWMVRTVDELGLERRLSVLEQHLDDLAQILLQFVDFGALAVSAGPARHVADQQVGARVKTVARA